MADALTLTAPVGERGNAHGSLNHPEDVQKVQDILNAIPVTVGGPAELLSLDGKAGRLTKKAIQEFQLKHFGWKLADGRVDPGGKTWERMLSLLGVYGGTRWSVRRMEQRLRPDKPFRDADSKDRFYEVFSEDGRQRALYYFQTPDQHLPRGYEVPFDLDGLPEFCWFNTQAPCSVYAFVAVAGNHFERSPTAQSAVINLQIQPLRADIAPAGLSLLLNHSWIVPSSTPGADKLLRGSFRFLRGQCVGEARQKTPRRL